MVTVTIETLCVRDVQTNPTDWQIIISLKCFSINDPCQQYREFVQIIGDMAGELKGLILKLSEGHELTEAWPAS